MISGKYYSLDIGKYNTQPTGEWRELQGGSTSFYDKAGLPTGTCVYMLSGFGTKYIGTSSEVRSRLYHHACTLNAGIHSNEYLQNVVNKYGQAGIFFQVLTEIKPEDIAYRNAIENAFIKLHDTYKNGFNLCEFADSSSHKCIKTYTLLSPEGELVTITNLRRFAKENGLNYKVLNKAANGKRITVGGWKHPSYLKPKWERQFSFITPKGERVETNRLRQFCRDNGLDYSTMSQLHSGKKQYYKGWLKG